jgi:hypothetical protein
MTLAETGQARPNGRGADLSNVVAKVRDNVSNLKERVSWPPTRRLENLARSPRIRLGPPGRKMRLSTDRVRAAPAISPTLSMNIGMTAIGLGLWGFFFPRAVKRTLGIRAPWPVVQGLFGLRELWTGFTLAGDPTKYEMLWTRVAGDVFDIAVLRALDNPRNPQRGVAKAALGFVLAVTALDVITAMRMTNVKRNCV